MLSTGSAQSHAPPDSAIDSSPQGVLPALGWGALVLLALWWGQEAIVGRVGVFINAAPFFGRWRLHAPLWWLIPAGLFGLLVALVGPRLFASMPWKWVPPIAGIVGVAWAFLLAVSAGWDELTRPLTNGHEYEPLAARIDDLGAFWRGFTEQAGGFPTHVQSHPPGAPTVPYLLDRIGLSGPGWLALVVVCAWGVAVAAPLWAQRWIAGEAVARRAAPALCLLPAAIWAATSMDSLFAAVTAVGLALIAGAVARGSAWLALGGGMVLGVSLLLSYGAALLVVAAAALLIAVRKLGVLWRAGFGVAVVLGVAGLFGFWWLEGLMATREFYFEGVAAKRSGVYFTLVGNPAALALALGPGFAVGLAAIWRSRNAIRSEYLAPLAVLVAVAGANLSQLSRGEVERIWLPFMPWLALAIPGHHRAWLVASVLGGLVLEGFLRTEW